MNDHTVDELQERVAAAEKTLADAKAAAAFKEFPKHVEPHASHIHKAPGTGHISTPGFSEHHVDRHDKLTVLVRDAEEEAKALAAASEVR